MILNKYVVGLFLSSSLMSFGQVNILNENFSNGFPAGWKSIVQDKNTVDNSVSEFKNGWVVTSPSNNLSDTVVGSTSFFTTTAQADRWLITKEVSLGAFGNFLTWKGRSHDPSFPDSYLVMISTKNDVASFKDTLTVVLDELAGNWVTHELDLSQKGYNSKKVYIAFVHRSFDAFKLYLDDIIVRKEDPVGISEQNNSNLAVSIYPNPSNDIVNFKHNLQKNGSLTILDLNGKIQLETTIEENNFSLNLDFLNKGIYIAVIHSDNQQIIKKIILE